MVKIIAVVGFPSRLKRLDCWMKGRAAGSPRKTRSEPFRTRTWQCLLHGRARLGAAGLSLAAKGKSYFAFWRHGNGSRIAIWDLYSHGIVVKGVKPAIDLIPIPISIEAPFIAGGALFSRGLR